MTDKNNCKSTQRERNVQLIVSCDKRSKEGGGDNNCYQCACVGYSLTIIIIIIMIQMTVFTVSAAISAKLLESSLGLRNDAGSSAPRATDTGFAEKLNRQNGATSNSQ